MNQTTQFSLVVAAVVATFCVVVWVRSPPPSSSLSADAGADGSALVDGASSSDGGDPADENELEVKEIVLVDGSENQRSIRLIHPYAPVTRRVLDWLEPREAKAVKENAQIACQADTATKRLVSVRCVTIAFFDTAKGATAPPPDYTAITLSITGSGFASSLKELTLNDVLKPDAGEPQVLEACKKMQDPPLACKWPPTAFSIVHGESLFFCHEGSCVDIEEDANLLREGLAGAIRH